MTRGGTRCPGGNGVPRACGGTWWWWDDDEAVPGLSPRMRGNLYLPQKTGVNRGSIRPRRRLKTLQPHISAATLPEPSLNTGVSPNRGSPRRSTVSGSCTTPARVSRGRRRGGALVSPRRRTGARRRAVQSRGHVRQAGEGVPEDDSHRRAAGGVSAAAARQHERQRGAKSRRKTLGSGSNRRGTETVPESTGHATSSLSSSSSQHQSGPAKAFFDMLGVFAEFDDQLCARNVRPRGSTLRGGAVPIAAARPGSTCRHYQASFCPWACTGFSPWGTPRFCL